MQTVGAGWEAEYVGVVDVDGVLAVQRGVVFEEWLLEKGLKRGVERCRFAGHGPVVGHVGVEGRLIFWARWMSGIGGRVGWTGFGVVVEFGGCLGARRVVSCESGPVYWATPSRCVPGRRVSASGNAG